MKKGKLNKRQKRVKNMLKPPQISKDMMLQAVGAMIGVAFAKAISNGELKDLTITIGEEDESDDQ
jgi:hypothetical protein